MITLWEGEVGWVSCLEANLLCDSTDNTEKIQRSEVLEFEYSVGSVLGVAAQSFSP